MNLHISTTNTFGILLIDIEISNYVNLCVRFGPAIISELDCTLLGRTCLDLLRESLGCDSLHRAGDRLDMPVEAGRECARTRWKESLPLRLNH